MVYGADLTTMSGGPKPSRAAFHSLSVTSGLGGGISFGSPCGAPSSTQRTIVSICASLSDMSFLNFCTPTLRSMCHGGICRAATEALGIASLRDAEDLSALDGALLKRARHVVSENARVDATAEALEAH